MDSLHSQFTVHALLVYSEKVFESLDAGYLEKCGMNIKAPLHGIDVPTQVSSCTSFFAIFEIADVSFVSQESVDSLIEAAKIELNAAMIDNRLAMLVAAAFTACNKDFWTKIEANIKLGTDSQQVVGKNHLISISCCVDFSILPFHFRRTECIATAEHHISEYDFLSQCFGETNDSTFGYEFRQLVVGAKDS